MGRWGRPWRHAPRTVAIATALVVVWVPLPAGASSSNGPRSPSPRVRGRPEVGPVRPLPRALVRTRTDTSAARAPSRIYGEPCPTRCRPPQRVCRSSAARLGPRCGDLAQPALRSTGPCSSASVSSRARRCLALRGAGRSREIVRDAGAIISVGLAREGTDSPTCVWTRGSRTGTTNLAGFVGADDEMEYEGVHVPPATHRAQRRAGRRRARVRRRD